MFSQNMGPHKSLTMLKDPDSLAFWMSDGPVLSPQICADTGQLSSWRESQAIPNRHLYRYRGSCLSYPVKSG